MSRERVVAAAKGCEPSNPGATRLRWNVASHVFTGDFDFIDEASLWQAQRGNIYRFDVWFLLSGMRSSAPGVAGALLLPGPSSGDIFPSSGSITAINISS